VLSLAAVALGVAACTGINEGPLVGSRAGFAESQICVPLGEATTAYFGEVATNEGDEDLTITKVTAGETDGLDPSEVTFLLDPEEPNTETFAGTFVAPADDDFARQYAGPILDRSVPMRGSVVPAGAEVGFVVGITPRKLGSGPSTLTGYYVEYEIGNRQYTERIGTEYVAERRRC